MAIANRRWHTAIPAVAVLIILSVICILHFSNPYNLPSTAQLLRDEQMQNIRGGKQNDPNEPPDPVCDSPKGKAGKKLHISGARGNVETNVSICTVKSSDGSTIDLVLHYDSGKADGSISRRQTVLGYGWTHNYNIHLKVRLQEVTMPSETGRITHFRKRFDGGYTASTGYTHTLSRVDPNTFLLEGIDGEKRTFELFDPSPWPESGQLFQLTQIEDAQGRTTTLGYNAHGLLETITNSYGRQLSLTYNANKRIQTITNADAQVTQIDYQNADDDLWRITDPLGYTLEYAYDSQNRMTTEKLKDGNTWTCVYNNGKPYQLVDGDGQIYATVTNSVEWAIDMDHLLRFNNVVYIPGQTTITDGCGNVTIYHCNERAYITKIENPDGTETTYGYNQDFRLTRKTDEEGNSWLYEYDEHENQTKITDPLGNETRMFYEHLTIPSLLTKRIEADGDEWIYEHDLNGNLIKEIDPIVESPTDAVIIHSYNANSLRNHTIDRNGHLTKWEYNPDGTLAAQTVDPNGLNIITDYECDAAGRRTKHIAYRGPGRADPVVTDYDYDAMGQRTRETLDPNGLNLTTAYEYDGDGRVTRQTNPRDIITDYTYDVRGQLISEIVDPNGLNISTLYEYDGCDNRTKKIDPNSNEMRYEYNSRNRLVKVINAENYWTLYEYDGQGNQTLTSRSIGPGGPPYRVTEYRYDELNRRIQKIADPCGMNLATVFEYTPSGGCGCTGTPGSSLIYKTTDPAGKVTYYYYDQLNRLSSEIRKVNDTNDNGGDSDDAIINYEYDYIINNTRVTVESAPHTDMVTAYTYDAADRLTEKVQSPGDANLVTTHSYDGTHNVIQETTPEDNVIIYVYDKARRLTGKSDSIGTLEGYTYDENGNVLTKSDGLSHTWVYTYDNANRRITAKDPLIETPTDKYTTNEYDDNSNLTRKTDNEGLVTVYTYDGLNRRITMTKDPTGLDITITYAYDGLGNQKQITDDNGNTTAYEYDATNRKTREFYADGTDILFSYDENSNMISRTDQIGNVTTYSYDDLNRLIIRDYANGKTDMFTYARAGQMLTADNDHSHIERSYDGAGRITSSTQTNLPLTYTHTVGYAYGETPNTHTITYPSGKEVVKVYDVRSRLTEVWQDSVKTAWYTYDNPGNRVLTKNFVNNTHIEYAYNNNDWITQLKHIAPSGTDIIAGFAHKYDAVGNRLDADNLQNLLPYDGGKPVTQSEKYTYDAIYRLIDFKRGQLVSGDIPSPTRTRIWLFDGVQNWTQFGIDDKSYTNSTNQMNEYDDPSTDGPGAVPDDDGLGNDFMVDVDVLKVDLDLNGEINLGDFVIVALYWLDGSCSAPNWCGGADFNKDGFVDVTDLDFFAALWLKEAGYNFAHDKNGNLIDDGQREYYHDYQTTMGGSLRSSNQMTMAKDKATGTTIGQYWYDALGRRTKKIASGISTVYVYTTNWHAIEEYENGALARNYSYGSWIDEAITMDRAAEADRLYYHSNGLGSIIAVTDNTGAATERYSYDAYGEPSFSDGGGNEIVQSAIANPYLFTSRRYDGETGLYNYRTRYLEPHVGRFTRRDTIGIWGDRSNLGNGYAYVGNAPINKIDWNGQKTNGVTRCGLSREVDSPLIIRNFNQKCSRPCTQAHEEQHAKDRESCCNKARKAYQAANGTQGRRVIMKKWNKWKRSTRAWTECNAYAKSVSCAEKLLKKKKKECVKCRKETEEYLKKIRKSLKRWCAKKGKNQDCPNFD